jgi:ribokinase
MLVPWDHVDVLVPNEQEARALLGDGRDVSVDELARSLSSDLVVPTVVVTLGKEGCVSHTAGATCRYAAQQAVTIDATGAGDAFMAAFTANLVARAPNSDAIRAAQANAGRAIQRTGGYESMPTRT